MAIETPQTRYDKKALRPFVLKVNRFTEPDILQRLETIDNRAGYIKRLIREDIAREKAQE